MSSAHKIPAHQSALAEEDFSAKRDTFCASRISPACEYVDETLPLFRTVGDSIAVANCTTIQQIAVDVHVATAVTPRTKAFMVVRIYDHPVDMDPIMAQAQPHGLSRIATLNFFANELITSGKGEIVRPASGWPMSPSSRAAARLQPRQSRGKAGPCCSVAGRRAITIGAGPRCPHWRTHLLHLELAERAVAMDSDRDCVRALYAEAADDTRLRQVPANPSGTRGCRVQNAQEAPGKLNRMRGSCDMALMLALIQNLHVSDGIPLSRIAALAARLTTRDLIIELLEPEEDTVQTLANQRLRSLDAFSLDLQLQAFARHFDVVRRLPLSPTRRQLA